jgi:hypothetical protein
MNKINFFVLFLITLVLVSGACGEDSREKPAQTNKSPVQAQESLEDAGVVVAKEILSTFDRAVGDVYELIKDKPEPEAVKSGLEEVYEKYTLRMKELNKKYLALKSRDIALFGSANRYLGEYRAKHVWNMNQKLDEIRFHYQREKNVEMDSLVHGKLINFLDMAVER